MRLSLTHMTLLFGYSVFMSLGQIAFKYISFNLLPATSTMDAVVRMLSSVGFWAIGALYGLSMVYWIWLLSQVPLSLAYPFASLAMIIVPVLSWLLFSEPLTIRYFMGVLLIMAGIALVVR